MRKVQPSKLTGLQRLSLRSALRRKGGMVSIPIHAWTAVQRAKPDWCYRSVAQRDVWNVPSKEMLTACLQALYDTHFLSKPRITLSLPSSPATSGTVAGSAASSERAARSLTISTANISVQEHTQSPRADPDAPGIMKRALAAAGRGT